MDDTKMRKHLIAMVAVALLGSSSMAALAADVGTNMDTLEHKPTFFLIVPLLTLA